MRERRTAPPSFRRRPRSRTPGLLPVPLAPALAAALLALAAPLTASAARASVVRASVVRAAPPPTHTTPASLRSTPATPRTTLPAVEAQVMCVTCKIPLPVAQSPQADRERVYIQKLIDQGRTLPQIKRALVFQYTSAVLALPPSHGFDLGVYLVPAIVAFALLATVAVLLPRWRARARAAQAAREAEQVPPPGALSAADAARLEADMARFD